MESVTSDTVEAHQKRSRRMVVIYIADDCPRPFCRVSDVAYSTFPFRRKTYVVIDLAALAVLAYHPDHAAIPRLMWLPSPPLAYNLRFLTYGCGHPFASW